MARLAFHVHSIKEMFDALIGQHLGVKQVHCSSASRSFVETSHMCIRFIWFWFGDISLMNGPCSVCNIKGTVRHVIA
jgi:hypothetical protein